MGFYKKRFNKNIQLTNRTKWIAAVLLSASVGAGSTLIAVPLMAKTNLLPLSQSTFAVSGNTSANNSLISTSNVSVKVNDTTVTAVSKVKSAIVGVANFSSS